MKLITLSLFCLLTVQYGSAQQYDDYLDAFDDKSNAAIITELKTFSETLERLEKIESIFKQEPPGIIAPKDEAVIQAFKFDPAAGPDALKRTLATLLTFKQIITGDGSEIAFDRNHDAPAREGRTFEITTKVSKVYFYDGTTLSQGIDELPLDYNFSEKWPYRKRIDSIEVTETLNTASGFDALLLTAQQPAALYRNKKIKIDKIDKNTIWFSGDKTIVPDFYEGLNKAGNVIDHRSSSSGTYKPETYRTIFAPLKEPLTAMIEKAIKDSAMDNIAFREKYKKAATALVKNIPRSDTRYYTAQYKGMINGVRLFIKKDSEEKSGVRGFKNGSLNNIHVYNNNDSSFFYDNAGTTIATFNSTLTQITDHYYENDQAYYYLNPGTSALEKLTCYNLEKVNASYVSCQEDAKMPYFLVNNRHQRLGPFEVITGSEAVAAALKEDGTLLIAGPEGIRATIKDVTSLGDFINHAAVIKIKGKYGFLDQDGKLAVPAVYDAVEHFSDMTTYTAADQLFAVKKQDRWGFVDRNNNTVIPFIYEEVAPFSFGVTMAKKAGNWGLIDTNNAVIVPFDKGSGYSLSTNFGKRSYGLGSGTYNHLGQKEKK